MFPRYIKLEEKIFGGVKREFEKLPATGSDDYKNCFGDLIAQYGFGGEEYVQVDDVFTDLIESYILSEYENLSSTDKKELQVCYERNFLENYYDQSIDNFNYSSDDLISEICMRFKTWMNDSFSTEDITTEED